MRLWGIAGRGQYTAAPHKMTGMSTLDCTPATTTPSPRAVARDWMTPLELTVLGAIWGASFLFMRVAAADFGPFPLVAVRLALGSLVLLPFLWRARAQFPLRL